MKSTWRSSVYAVLVAQNVTEVLAFATLEQKTAWVWTKQIHIKTHNFESLLTWIVRHVKVTEYQMVLEEMPCGPGKVVHCENPTEEVGRLETRLRTKKWFGFAEVDIRVPKELWEKSRRIYTVLQQLCSDGDDSKAHESVSETNQTIHINNQKALWTVNREEDFYMPRYWNGISSMVSRQRRCKISTWFVHEVTENWHRGDEDPDRALLAFKLLGNSAPEELLEAKERQTRMIYTKDQHVVDKAKRVMDS